MADPDQPILQACIKCDALMDVTEEEPFALMHCPACGESMRVRTQFGSFELQHLLGAGGMGSVYRALDLNLHRQVALKVLRKEYSANPEFIAQFAHEAAITAHVNHPNVVRVYSSGSEQGLFYIAMELVDKGSLDDLMANETAIAESQVLEVGIHVAKGLEAAFQRGLIHRDVKPGNILFADGNTAKIVDFGLAVPIDQAGTLDGEVWGTPYYVAPEKLDGRPEDFRSDMYSLAASLFHAIAGKPPYEVDDASINTLKELKSKPVSLQQNAPGVSSATAYVIDRAMHLSPDERYASYAEFITSLEYAQSELRKKARAATPKPPEKKMGRAPGSTRWTLTGVTLGIIAGSVALYPFKDQLLGTQKPVTDPATELAQKAGAEAEAEYQGARKQLTSGDYEEAAIAFRKLAETSSTPEPLQSWASFHAGLAHMLAGDRDTAATDWKRLIDNGPFSSAPEDQKLAGFFVATAQQAVADDAVPSGTENAYSRTNYEALAILAMAAKSWAAADFPRAHALFDTFKAVSPEGANGWIAEYKPIAEAHLADLGEYQAILTNDKATPGAVQAKATLPSLKDSQGRMKLKGPLRAAAAEKIQEVESRIAAYEEAQARMLAEAEAQDAAALAAAQEKARPLALLYRFDEAREVMATAPAATEKGKRDKAALLQRSTWLNQFKITLIRDLAAAGYPSAIQKKSGGVLPGVVSRATDSRVELKSQYGSVPVQWSDIAYESVLQMAGSFIRADAPVERQIERKWLLGVYALFAGKAQEGRVLLAEAAQANAEYRASLATFPELTAQ